MQVTLDIPDELAALMSAGSADLSRAALEALALQGYRTEHLSESQMRRLLGLETRMEVHAFLKEHGVYLHYSIEDLDRDREAARRMREQRRVSFPAGERLAG